MAVLINVNNATTFLIGLFFYEKLGVDPNEVTPAAGFTTDLGADSLDTVELIMEFEKEFGNYSL